VCCPAFRGIIIRAIERRNIFEDNKDRDNLWKRFGYDLDTIEDRVCEIYKIEKEGLFSRSRQKVKSDARALFCFWAHRELGLAQKELARRLGITQPGVGYAVIKGEAISKSNNYRIKTELLI
jgi:putative transposase